ncbi:conjugal transfer protein TraF [Flavobacterium zhairuonense]|nr:conjugal transfer protein TraF [Flavobacterium zhairuonense]
MGFLFLILAIGISVQGFAQKELDNKYKPIPAKTPKTKEVVPPKEEAPKVNPPAPVEKPDPSKIDPNELFKDTNLYKTPANVEGIFYRQNQFLGSFKTSTYTSTIRYRDAAFVDGDKIKVYLNDKVIEPEVTMNGEYQGFKITLVPGINKIDFEALNEGSASPNTAEFQVYDDKGAVIESSQWNVGTGYKATIVLYKE